MEVSCNNNNDNDNGNDNGNVVKKKKKKMIIIIITIIVLIIVLIIVVVVVVVVEVVAVCEAAKESAEGRRDESEPRGCAPLTASKSGQDKWDVRRSAAISHNCCSYMF